jgi:hypothetical protein
MHKAIRAFVILPCATLIVGALALQAAAVKSEKFRIPFDFQVQKQTLPAGEYTVQQADGSEIVLLINTSTGDRVEFIRPATTHQQGKVRLVFEGGKPGNRSSGFSDYDGAPATWAFAAKTGEPFAARQRSSVSAKSGRTSSGMARRAHSSAIATGTPLANDESPARIESK